MEDTQLANVIVKILFIGIPVFFIMVFFTRWIFGISKQIKHQQIMIKLLMKIAAGEKLTEDEKDGIKNEMNNP